MVLSEPPQPGYYSLLGLHLVLTNEWSLTWLGGNAVVRGDREGVGLALRQTLNSAMVFRRGPVSFPEAGQAIDPGLQAFTAVVRDSRARVGFVTLLRLLPSSDGRKVGAIESTMEPGQVYQYAYTTNMAEIAREVRHFVLPLVETTSG